MYNMYISKITKLSEKLHIVVLKQTVLLYTALSQRSDGRWFSEMKVEGDL